MAQKLQIILEDDIDGSQATETLSFGLDGKFYEIDLHEQNARTLRDAMAMYVGHARKASPGSGQGRRSSPNDGTSAREIREWARANGVAVTERGRVSAEVRQAFEAAH